MTRLTTGVAVLFLVVIATSTATAAPLQTAPPAPFGNGSNTSAVNASEWNASDAPGGGGWFPHPAELFTQFVTWALDELSGGLELFVAAFNEVILGLPAPGEPLQPGTWSGPTDGWWPAVWDVYWMFAGLGAFCVMAGGLAAFDMNQREQNKQLRTCMESTAAIFGGWIAIGLILHIGNAAALLFAPSGSEFMATPGSLGKLGVGIVLGTFLLFTQSVVILVAIVVLFAQFFLAHALAALWPLMWGLRALPIKGVSTTGEIGTAGLFTLALLKIFQAGLLRILFEIPWDAGQPGTALYSLMGTVIGLLVATVWLPKLAVSKMLPAAMMTLGAKHGSEHVRELRERTQSAAGSARERVTRSGGGDDSGGGRSASVGTVQSRQSSQSGSGTSGSDGTRSGARAGSGGIDANEHDRRDDRDRYYQ